MVVALAATHELASAAGGSRPARGGVGQADPLVRAKGGRLARRSQQQIEATLAKVIAAVKKSKSGLRAEEIRKQLQLDVREVPRVLKEGLKTKKLKAAGQKRATTYSAK